MKDNYKPLGYASLRFLEPDDLLEETVAAVNEISKYGGICVLPSFDPAQLATLMTLRLNIYTDPQKPIQVLTNEENEYDWLSSSRDSKAITKIAENRYWIVFFGLATAIK